MNEIAVGTIVRMKTATLVRSKATGTCWEVPARRLFRVFSIDNLSFIGNVIYYLETLDGREYHRTTEPYIEICNALEQLAVCED